MKLFMGLKHNLNCQRKSNNDNRELNLARKRIISEQDHGASNFSSGAQALMATLIKTKTPPVLPYWSDAGPMFSEHVYLLAWGNFVKTHLHLENREEIVSSGCCTIVILPVPFAGEFELRVVSTWPLKSVVPGAVAVCC